MSPFINPEEGRRLLELLQTGITADKKRPNQFPQPGENPLYEFQRDENGARYIMPEVQKVFELLGQNAYGGSYVQKTDEERKNRFRQGLTSRDPSWIGKLDMAEFDRLIYFFNDQNTKNIGGPHYVAERICDGTIHAILGRAMELGRFEKPAPSAQPSVVPAPVPTPL